MKHVDTQSKLTDCQHGFHARRSCESQLVTLTHVLASSLDNRKQTDMVVLDFLKAFDRFCLFVCYDSLRPINNLSVIKGRVFLG